MNIAKSLSVAGCLLVAISNAYGALFDRGGGLIFDDVLNVTWLQDTNYAKTSGFDPDGLMSAAQAQAWASSLVYLDPLRKTTWTDWRLPYVLPIDGNALKQAFASDGSSEVGYNILSPGNELPHLYYVGLSNPAQFPPTQGNVGPFLNTPSQWTWGHWYWTGTRYPYFSGDSFYYFDFLAGMQNVSDASNQHFAWVLRAGDVGAIPEPNPSVLVLTGIAFVALLGWSQKIQLRARRANLALRWTRVAASGMPACTSEYRR